MYNTLTPKNMKGSPMSSHSLEFLDSAYVDPKLLITSAKPSQQARANLYRPKNLLDKARWKIFKPLWLWNDSTFYKENSFSGIEELLAHPSATTTTTVATTTASSRITSCVSSSSNGVHILTSGVEVFCDDGWTVSGILFTTSMEICNGSAISFKTFLSIMTSLLEYFK